MPEDQGMILTVASLWEKVFAISTDVCFPTPEFNHPSKTLRPAERKTRARKYKNLCWEYTMMGPAVCVSLLESATLRCDRMQRE